MLNLIAKYVKYCSNRDLNSFNLFYKGDTYMDKLEQKHSLQNARNLHNYKRTSNVRKLFNKSAPNIQVSYVKK